MKAKITRSIVNGNNRFTVGCDVWQTISPKVVADIMRREKASLTFARYGLALKKDRQEAVVKREGVLFGAR